MRNTFWWFVLNITLWGKNFSPDLKPQSHHLLNKVILRKCPFYSEKITQLHHASTGLDPFCLQNCLNSSWHRFNKVLETFLRDFCPYWHDSIMQFLQICRLHIHEANLPFPPHPKGALLDWDLVTVEAIWVKWTHCHVQETSPRWLKLCDMVHYPAGSSIRRWVHCSHKGMDMVRNNTQVDCGVFIRCSIGTKGPKVCQENIPHTNTTSLNRWDKTGWIHAFMFFTPNSDPTIWMSQAEVKTHQTRQRISNLLLSNVGDPVWIVSSVCCS